MFPQPRLSRLRFRIPPDWLKGTSTLETIMLYPSVTDFRVCNIFLQSNKDKDGNIDTIPLLISVQNLQKSSEPLFMDDIWMKKVGLYYDYHPLYTLEMVDSHHPCWEISWFRFTYHPHCLGIVPSRYSQQSMKHLC